MAETINGMTLGIAAADETGEDKLVREAIQAGVRFLERRQLADGAFEVLTSEDPAMSAGGVPDPSIFPTAIIAQALADVPGADGLRSVALDFLVSQMDRHGLWRHWTRTHPNHSQLPPDLDDTACASQALSRAARSFPDNRRVILGNLNGQGLFFTWIVPRPRWRALRDQAAVTLPLLRHALARHLFFKHTSAAPADVDAVVNANTLYYLGLDAQTQAVADHLIAVLKDDREAMCDKWYDNPFVIWYFLARALGPTAGPLIEAKIAGATPETALEIALMISALLACGRAPPSGAISRLAAKQSPLGAWPCAALYHGGRERLRDGSVAAVGPGAPYWGSEELTTALCVEALTRSRNPQKRYSPA